MLRCCIVCKAEASPDLQLQYCATCQSALYCSRACQKTDWKQHKKICKLLNVGHGDMQMRNDIHTERSKVSQEDFERNSNSLDEGLLEGTNRFFKLFEKSTFEGSQAAARKMKNIVKRMSKLGHKMLLFHSLYLLIHSDSEKLSWPNSPLLVLLEFVDTNVLNGDEDAPLQEGDSRASALHVLANMADPSDYSTHENQLILAKQLIKHGANVNAVSSPNGETPLHNACHGANVTNLDFVEILLKQGADQNTQNYMGLTPMMVAVPLAPGAAKFLLNWPTSTTDVNITTRSGATILSLVRVDVKYFANEDALSTNSDQWQVNFLLQQLREIEEMLVAKGAHDSGVATLE
jgi:hypothetical protein